jgi:hypothetical protein
MEIIPLTRSLGLAVEGEPAAPETYTWTDTSGACVRVQLVGGRLRQWSLERPAESPGAAQVAVASDKMPDSSAGA